MEKYIILFHPGLEINTLAWGKSVIESSYNACKIKNERAKNAPDN